MRFSEIVGHRRLVRLLSTAAGRGTVPPTLLFVGPPGVGKWRTAQTVAAAVNCQTPVEGDEIPFDACGSCAACKRVSRGVHVDVLALEPDEKASIKIDVVRDLLSRIGFRPFEGRRRFVLLREAETLEIPAQNALLKSLEEPPPATSFILTTSVPGVLLPTVRSRSMRMAFGRLTQEEVAAALVARGVDAVEARAAAGLADGSVGQALALGSADLEVIRETALRLLQQTAGAGAMSTRLQAAASIVTTSLHNHPTTQTPRGGGPGNHPTTQTPRGGGPGKERTREDIGLVLRAIASLLRDLEVLNGGADRRVLANPAMADDLGRLTRAFPGDRARAAFQAVDRAIYALQRNVGFKVVAEWLASKI